VKVRRCAASSVIPSLSGILVLVAASTARASGPAVQLSPSVLTFPSQLATTTSAPMMSTLTNVGDGPLTITSVSVQGTFAQTNTCPTSGTLAAGSSCTFSVMFVAPNGGPSAQPGFVEIADNATPGLQLISLSGTVADFSLAATPTTATVAPGSGGTYTITVTATGGFNQAVSLTCGTLPTGASCGFSPSSITPTVSGATTTLTVSTSAGSGSPWSRRNPPLGGVKPPIMCGLLIVLAGALFFGRRAARGRILGGTCAVALLLAAILGTFACGGGGNSSSGGGSGSVATPAGTYTILITGSPTAGPSSLANPLILTLVVN
jgi:hypothetical protein